MSAGGRSGTCGAGAPEGGIGGGGALWSAAVGGVAGAGGGNGDAGVGAGVTGGTSGVVAGAAGVADGAG